MAGKQGRPSKYEAKIHDDLVYKLAMDNKTNDEIADILGISRSTFYDWCDAHESFSDSLKKGQEAKIDKVVMNLYQRANGMEYKETKKTVVKGSDGKTIGKAEITETTKYIPPDVGAICFILKTQRPDQFREKQEIDLGDNSLTINVAPATKGDIKEE